MGSKAPSRVRIPHSPPSSMAPSRRFSDSRFRDPRFQDRSAGISVPGLTSQHRVGKIPLLHHAPVAQLDRAPGYELGGRRFESFRARQIPKASPRGLAFFVLRAQEFTARRSATENRLHAKSRFASAGEPRLRVQLCRESGGGMRSCFRPVHPFGPAQRRRLMRCRHRGTAAAPTRRTAHPAPAGSRGCLRRRSGRGP